MAVSAKQAMKWLIVQSHGMPAEEICLGQIIRDPRVPDDLKLNEKDPAPIVPPLGAQAGGPLVSPLTTCILDTTTARKVRGGVFADLLNMVDAGLSIGGGIKRHQKVKIEAARMTKQYFKPDKHYIMAAIRDPDVYDYVSEFHYRKPVYMVVGLVVATGAHTVSEQSRGGDIKARVGVEVPGTVSVGPSFAASRSGQSTFTSTVKGDSVVAYSLIKIKVRKSGGVESARVTDHGRLLGVEDANMDADPANMEFIVEPEPVSRASLGCQESACVAEDEDGDVFEYVDK